MPRPRYADLTIHRRLLRQARPYWPHLGGIFLLSLLSIPLALLAPLPFKIAIDSVIGSDPLPSFLEPIVPAAASQSRTALLAVAAGMVVLISVLDQLQRLASSLLGAYTGEQLVLGFRAQLFRHVQRLSLSYHDSRGATDSTYRIQYDAPAIQWVLIDGIVPLIASSVTLAGMILVTAQLDWQLALIALAVAPVLWMLFRIYGSRLRSRWLEVYSLHSSAMSVVQEVLAAMRVVKAFGQEDREHERFIRYSREGIWARIRVAFAEGGFGLLVGLTIAAGTAAVLFVGAAHVHSRTLTVGELTIVMAYLAQLYARLETLGRTGGHLQASFACAERAFSVLDEIPEVTERPDARPLSRARGAVAFRDVCFDYSADRPVLRDISFEIGPGARVAIVGATGAGKTTLVGLLTRFYDPTAGQILLDGVDLRDWRLAELRNQFAIVLQEPVLFSTTIAENISYGRPGAHLEDIVAAATAANAHQFVERLSDGYDTLVGERGMRLSGGERQRISLARAFLRDAPVLVLDEPTSAVDIHTEAAIVEATERLIQDRTTFVISHRATMLKHCDLVLVMRDGQLVYQGTPPERFVERV